MGKRERPGEHEAMRKIKNEFMSYWDGLKTKDNERVLVLAATNRPFDLDDAVLRRLSRRLLIDLPNQENRVKILKVVSSILLKACISFDQFRYFQKKIWFPSLILRLWQKLPKDFQVVISRICALQVPINQLEKLSKAR